MFAALLIHTVSIVNPVVGVGVNIYGDPDETFTSPVVEPARIEAGGETGGSTEILVGRDTRISTFRAFLLATSVITALSTVTWNGTKYRVKGDPVTMDDRSGPHHIEAILELITG